MKTRINYIAIIILLLFSLQGKAQGLLDKKMTLNVNQKPTEVVMLKLEQIGNFNFSYQTKLIDLERIVSMEERNKELELILDKLFKNELTYKEIGSHIILQAKNPDKAKDYTVWVLSGKITDQNGNPLENAIIYEINCKASYVTHNNGLYNLRLQEKGLTAFNISCKGYKDTIAFVNPFQTKEFNVQLQAQQLKAPKIQYEKLNAKALKWDYTNKEFEDLGMVQMLVDKNAILLSNQIQTNERRMFQFSLLPNIGTNALSKGVISNDYSLNLIAGYAANVNILEIAAGANIIRENVKGVQIAGATNIVGNNVKGVQIAGGMNTNLGSTKGVQVAGAFNRTKGDLKGLQIAGGLNLSAAKWMDTTQTPGWNGQVAGGMNLYGGAVTNLQVSGGYNQANRVTGLQNSGGYNHANEVRGAQITGGMNNVRGSVKGLQIAGAVNIAKEEVKGVQIAGLYNRTQKLNGLQIALVNHADTIENGVPIGLINILKTGYHRWEFSTDESFYLNAAYKTGGKHFYSYLQVGAGEYLNASYGFGYTSDPKRKFSVNLDLVSSSVFNTDSDYDVFAGNLYRAQLGFTFKLVNDLQLSIGPSFNFFRPDQNQKSGTSTNYADKNTLYFGNHYLDKGINTRDNQYWVGWQFGLRF